MEQIIPFDWQRIFLGTEPYLYFLEIVFRVVMIYGFGAIVLRYMGKRGRRQMTPFEYMVIIALGSATGDSMFYPEVPIFYAWLVILLMVLLDNLITRLQFSYKSVNVFTEGVPILLVFEGKIVRENLNNERIRLEEFLSMLREKQIQNTGEIRYAFLEPSGNLGLLLYDKGSEQEGQSVLSLLELEKKLAKVVQ